MFLFIQISENFNNIDFVLMKMYSSIICDRNFYPKLIGMKLKSGCSKADVINMNFTTIHKISNMHPNASATQNEYQKQKIKNPRLDEKEISVSMRKQRKGSFYKNF